ncbi:DUF6020 family protein [Paenibacillus alvei]|uniref:Glycosyltransferase RgtA/B/C/D-like domain-containing protein n=1 Tax=Paenibacillus alvei TaxID=44250 RepID=A0A383RJI9_PAEAL|nr:DUF6020 family protein [Paenibacillus alvei]SYX86456.1 conserved membrane protein of unknown function [Paenibacillus alvei]
MNYKKYAGYIFCYLLILTISHHFFPSIERNTLIWICFILLFGTLVGLLLNKTIIRLYYNNIEHAKKYKIVCLIFSILFVLMIPFKNSQFVTLNINALADKNSQSQGIEVWIKELTVDGKVIDLNTLQYEGQWEVVHESPVSHDGGQAVATWEGLVDKSLEIKLGNHPHSGLAEVKINDNIEKVDLYSPDDQIKTITHHNKSLLSISFYIFFLINIYIVFIILYICISNIRANEKVEEGTKAFCFKCTIPSIIVSFFYLLVYYPGLMSGDSIDQWRQISSFDFNDAHPFYDTFIKYIITRIWYSPAMIVITQIIYFCCVWFYAMSTLCKIGVNKKVLVSISVLFSLIPINGLYLISVWKDVPYSISILLLSIILINVFHHGARWFDNNKNVTLIILTMILVLMFRHNGIIPVYGSVLALLLFYNKRKKIILVALSVTIIFFGSKHLALQALHSGSSPSVLTMSLPIQQIGSMLANDVEFTDEQKEIINQAMDYTLWKGLYNPYVVDPIIFNNQFNMHVFDKPNYKSEFIKVWLDKTISNPIISIKSWLKQSSIVWRMSEPNNGSTLFSERGIVKTGVEMLDKYNLKTESLTPEIKNDINKYLDRSQEKETVWLIWRPAIYIFITMLSMIVLMIRLQYKAVIIFAPAILNVLGLMLSIPAQQVRYLYSSVLFGIIALALLFVFERKNRIGEEGK